MTCTRDATSFVFTIFFCVGEMVYLLLWISLRFPGERRHLNLARAGQRFLGENL